MSGKRRFDINAQFHGKVSLGKVLHVCCNLLDVLPKRRLPYAYRGQRVDMEPVKEMWLLDLGFAREVDKAIHEEEAAIEDIGVRILTVWRVMNHLFVSGFPEVSWDLHITLIQSFHVDIHPKTHLGCPGRVDHPFSIIIGEETKFGVGDIILAGTTLGVRRIVNERSGCCSPRHPIIEDGVILYLYSSVFGNATIERDARIGAHSVVKKNVGRNSTVGANAIINANIGANCKIGDGAIINRDVSSHTTVEAGERIV